MMCNYAVKGEGEAEDAKENMEDEDSEKVDAEETDWRGC